MKILYIHIISFFLLASTILTAQKVSSELGNYSSSHHLEKIYLSFDKPYYIPGDMIWAKIWHVDGRQHMPFDKGSIVYVDWINPEQEIISTDIVKIELGTAEISIPTGIGDQAGDYTIRAYTLYQRNFDAGFIFQKTIPLIDGLIRPSVENQKAESTNIAFYPEGGYLVEGIRSSVAIEIMDEYGIPIATRGKLIEGNKVIAEFASNNDGLGKVNFTPQVNNSYYVELISETGSKRYALPNIQKNGFALTADGTRKDKILITSVASVDRSLLGSKLIAHIRGIPIMEYTIEDARKKELLINRAAIPSGIIHFTLFDKKNNPISERLVFNLNPDSVSEVVIQTNEESYTKQEEINLSISTLQNTKSISSNFSVTAFNEEVIENKSIGPNIMDYFLLYSDIPDKGMKLSGLINNYKAVDRLNLDLFMMTKGWRRFEWKDIQAGDFPVLNYPVEHNYTLAGKVSRTLSNRPLTADVGISIFDDKQFSNVNLTTTDDGFFYFSELNLQDSVDILIEASIPRARHVKNRDEDVNKIRGNREVDIEILKLEEWALDSTMTYMDRYEIPAYAELPNYQVQSYRNKVGLDSSLWSINIDEVSISAGVNKATQRERAIKEKYDEIGLFYFASTQKFLVDSTVFEEVNLPSLFELIDFYVPRAKMVTNGGVKQIIYGRLSQGAVADIFVNGNSLDDQFLTSIDPEDIFSIDVVLGEYALSIYGDTTVISVITKTTDVIKQKTPGVFNYNHLGYHKAAEFYRRLIPDPNNQEQTIDYSTTLYWNAKGSNNETPFLTTFKTSELTGRHCIQVEGMTIDGHPLFGKKCFEVQ